MPLLDHETHPAPSDSKPSPGSPKSKADKRKQTIIAIGAVLTVALTYLLYRRSQNASATTPAASTAGTPVDTSGGGVAGSDGGGASDASLLGQIGSDYTQLLTQMGTLGKRVNAASATNKSQAANIASLRKRETSQAHRIALLKAREEKLAKEVHAHKATNHKKKPVHHVRHHPNVPRNAHPNLHPKHPVTMS